MEKEEAVSIIRALLSSSKNPCPLYSLNKDFKNETNIDIPLYGYETLSDFLHSIPETVKVTGIYPVEQVHIVANEKSAHIVHLVQRQKNASGKQQKKKFYPLLENNILSLKECNKIQNLNYSKNKNQVLKNKFCIVLKGKVEEKLSSNFNFTLNRPLEDNNILKFGEKISSMDLSHYAQIGTYVEVCTCKIHHPQHFYLQLRKFKKKLVHLMDKLLEFYSSDDDIFKMSEDAVKPKQTCVAFYKISSNNGVWLRAEIIEVLNKSQVTVNLIDYGATVDISKKNLRYLHRQFSFLPKQAFLASLANVKPKNNSNIWPKNAIKRFFNLINNKELIAGVVKLNLKIPSMSAALTFTESEELHINDTLVKEGLADFSFPKTTLNEKTYSIGQTVFIQKSSENSINNYKEQPLKSYNPIIFHPSNNDLKKMFNHENEF